MVKSVSSHAVDLVVDADFIRVLTTLENLENSGNLLILENSATYIADPWS